MDYTILSNKPVNVELSKLSSLDIEIVDIDIQNAPLPDGYHLIVADYIKFDTSLLAKISAALAPRGFVLLVENMSTTASSVLKSVDLQIVTIIENNNKKYFLLKKVIQVYYLLLNNILFFL